LKRLNNIQYKNLEGMDLRFLKVVVSVRNVCVNSIT